MIFYFLNVFVFSQTILFGTAKLITILLIKQEFRKNIFAKTKNQSFFFICSQYLYQDLIASFRDYKSLKARFFLPLQKNESYGFTVRKTD